MQGHNTFYITAKGVNRANELFQFENSQGLHDHLIAFLATSGDMGVTPEFYVVELGGDLAEVKNMILRLVDEKYLTIYKSSVCKRVPEVWAALTA